MRMCCVVVFLECSNNLHVFIENLQGWIWSSSALLNGESGLVLLGVEVAGADTNELPLPCSVDSHPLKPGSIFSKSVNAPLLELANLSHEYPSLLQHFGEYLHVVLDRFQVNIFINVLVVVMQ